MADTSHSHDDAPVRGDDSPPRNNVIAFYTLLSVMALICLKPIFDSYYHSMFSSEQERKISQEPELANRVRRVEEERLASARVSVDRAMEELARRGPGQAPAVVAPQVSNDLGALEGWNKLPPFVATHRAGAATVVLPPPPEPAPAAPPADGVPAVDPSQAVVPPAEGGAPAAVPEAVPAAPPAPEVTPAPEAAPAPVAPPAAPAARAPTKAPAVRPRPAAAAAPAVAPPAAPAEEAAPQ